MVSIKWTFFNFELSGKVEIILVRYSQHSINARLATQLHKKTLATLAMLPTQTLKAHHVLTALTERSSVFRGTHLKLRTLTGGVFDGEDLRGLTGITDSSLVLSSDLELDLGSLVHICYLELRLLVRSLTAFQPAAAKLLLLLNHIPGKKNKVLMDVLEDTFLSHIAAQGDIKQWFNLSSVQMLIALRGRWMEALAG